jgi:hypothetical protein
VTDIVGVTVGVTDIVGVTVGVTEIVGVTVGVGVGVGEQASASKYSQPNESDIFNNTVSTLFNGGGTSNV